MAAKLKLKRPEVRSAPLVPSSLEDFKIPKLTKNSTKLDVRRVSELQNFEKIEI